MLVFLCICILVLSVIAADIRVGVNFYLDLFGNVGTIKAYVFGIRIFLAHVYFEHDEEGNNNLVIRHGKKQGKIHLNTDTEDKKSVAAMMKNPAFSLMDIEKLSFHCTAGKQNDAFFTVALLQALRVLFYGALAPIKCRYDVSISEEFTPVYNKDILQVDFIGIIEVSIADITVGCINGLLQKVRMLERKKQEAVQ